MVLFLPKLILLATILFCKITLNAANLICPPASAILPCSCNEAWEEIICGSGATNEIIGDVFTTVRLANNISSDQDWLDMGLFQLQDSNLTSLDLTSFVKTRFRNFGISTNPNLTSFLTGTNSSDQVDIEPFQFVVGELLFHNCSLGDLAVGEFLKFVDPDTLKTLTFFKTDVKGSTDGGEFVPGLWTFRQLSYLQVGGGDKINQLSGGQFRKNNRLSYFTLVAEDPFNFHKIGEDAFLFDPPEDDMKDIPLTIQVNGHELLDENFDPNSGLTTIGRPVRLLVEYNKMEFLSAQNFEPFLRANGENSLSGLFNPFICDERMRWLHDAREEFEHRVFYIDCANDPGHTIFDTDLLP